MPRGSASVVLVAGAVLFAVTRATAALPATLAVLAAVVVLADAGGRRAPVFAGAAALLSTAWTAASIGTGHRLGTDLAGGLLTLAETLAILVAVAFVVARAAARPAAMTVVLGVVAVAATVLRSAAAEASVTTALGVAVWGLLVLGAAAAGLYLRALAARQAAAVEAAQRAHRLRVAADLHDYVAHDVSEMLALAQAGRVVSGDPRAAELFEAIERAAQHSMLSLDRAVAALGDLGERDEPPVLGDLLLRFERAAAARVETDVDAAVLAALPAERAALLHRIVTEALTNVRRHAPAADLVRVEVRRDGATVRVSIVDNGTAGGAPPRGGRGLASLRDRVTAAGGTLTAGPSGARPPAGWRVTAVLPR